MRWKKLIKYKLHHDFLRWFSRTILCIFCMHLTLSDMCIYITYPNHQNIVEIPLIYKSTFFCSQCGHLNSVERLYAYFLKVFLSFEVRQCSRCWIWVRIKLTTQLKLTLLSSCAWKQLLHGVAQVMIDGHNWMIKEMRNFMCATLADPPCFLQKSIYTEKEEPCWTNHTN